jgi:hypothetical protein
MTFHNKFQQQEKQQKILTETLHMYQNLIVIICSCKMKWTCQSSTPDFKWDPRGQRKLHKKINYYKWWTIPMKKDHSRCKKEINPTREEREFVWTQ